MGFKDIYISESEAQVKPDSKKLTLSNDAYAIGELLEKLLFKLREFQIK